MEDSFTFYSDKLSFAEVKGKNGTDYFIKGHISTGDLDLVDDIVTKDCLDDMYSQFDSKNMKLDFEHEAFRGKSKIESEINKTKLPLGKAIAPNIDKKGLEVNWQLNSTWQKFDSKGNVTMGFKELWSNVENKYLDAFSIAYIPISTEVKYVDGKKVRLLKRIKLLNVALTGNPVNTKATMSAVFTKSLDSLKKAYDKDGAHAHTEENPIGNHTHPEIERAIDRMYEYTDNRINWVKEDNNLKSHGGNKMADNEEENEEEKKKNDADTKDLEVKDDKLDMVEVKALVKSITELTTEVKSVKDEIKGLKDKSDEHDKILSKAQTKALGAEAKGKEAELAETKSTAPKSVMGMVK